jgi:hypothetical protein
MSITNFNGPANFPIFPLKNLVDGDQDGSSSLHSLNATFCHQGYNREGGIIKVHI